MQCSLGRVVWSLYQRRNLAASLAPTLSNAVSHVDYWRIFAMASFDIVFTLPFGIVTLSLFLLSLERDAANFYSGWNMIHSEWTPTVKESSTYSDFIRWMNPVLSAVIFGLFGTTPSACAAYRTIAYILPGRFTQRALCHQKVAPQKLRGSTQETTYNNIRVYVVSSSAFYPTQLHITDPTLTTMLSPSTP